MNDLEVTDQELDITQRSIHKSEAVIKSNEDLIGVGMWNIGNELMIIRDTKSYKEKGYESFEKYTKNELNYSRSHVYNFITIADKYNVQSIGQVGNLGINKLVSLAQLDLKDRQEFIENNEVEKMTTRELKQAIKEKKQPIQDKQVEKVKQLAGQIDIADIVEVTAIEVVEDKRIEATQDTQTIDIDTIYNLALSKLEEINIRQGYFYNDNYGFLEVSDISSLIITMHQNGELTLKQMTQIAQKYELDIPIVFSLDQGVLDRYYEQLDKICNSYRQYIEKDTYNYDTVESYNLDYATVVLCEFEDDLKLRKEYQDNMKELLISEDNITFIIGYDDSSTENLCVYRDKKLIANYNFHSPESDKHSLNDWSELENYITKLFELDGINNKYIELLHKLKCQCDTLNKAHLQIVLDNNKKSAKFTYVEDDFTFLILNKNIINKGDAIYIYEGLKEIGQYYLKENIRFGEEDFDIEITRDQDIKVIRDIVDSQLWKKFRDRLVEEHRRLYKAREEKQRQQREQYSNYSNSNYDYSKMFSSSSSGTGSKLIDGIAKLDKVKKKDIYKALSKHLHPDMGGSTELMQFVTELKQEWGV